MASINEKASAGLPKAPLRSNSGASINSDSSSSSSSSEGRSSLGTLQHPPPARSWHHTLLGLWKHYLAFALPGLGMFCEAYIIFSVGNIGVFQQTLFPKCFSTYEKCPRAVIEQKTDSYIQICGVMLGMLLMGLSADRIGRKWGSRVVGAVMLSGVLLLTLSPFARTAEGYFAFFMVAQTWYGIGVGGEYPLAASSAAERAEGNRKLRQHRGREVVLVFSNQGLGNFANCVVILVAMAIFGQTGSTLTRLGSRNVVALQYGVGAAVCVWMVVYRMRFLHESKYYEKEHAAAAKRDAEAARSCATTPSRSWRTFLAELQFYGPRQFAASAAWVANDFTFYGNKLQQAFFVTLLHPDATPYQKMQFVVLNSAVALAGYYAAAAVIDQRWYGRRTCQIVGFLMLFFLNIVIFIDYEQLTDPQVGTAAAAHWFQAIYYLSSFFNQFGPNCTTWLVAGEIFPTANRASNHGLAATMGKLGAIVSSIWIVNLSNPRDVFMISALWAIGGALITWVFLPDTTGLNLSALDDFHCCLTQDRVEHYHAEAVNPHHLSMWENATGWGTYYQCAAGGVHTPIPAKPARFHAMHHLHLPSTICLPTSVMFEDFYSGEHGDNAGTGAGDAAGDEEAQLVELTGAIAPGGRTDFTATNSV